MNRYDSATLGQVYLEEDVRDFLNLIKDVASPGIDDDGIRLVVIQDLIQKVLDSP